MFSLCLATMFNQGVIIMFSHYMWPLGLTAMFSQNLIIMFNQYI